VRRLLLLVLLLGDTVPCCQQGSTEARRLLPTSPSKAAADTSLLLPSATAGLRRRAALFRAVAWPNEQVRLSHGEGPPVGPRLRSGTLLDLMPNDFGDFFPT